MGTNCAPRVVDYFLFSYERDFTLSLCDNYQADAVKAINSISRYLDCLFLIFTIRIGQKYPIRAYMLW